MLPFDLYDLYVDTSLLTNATIASNAGSLTDSIFLKVGNYFDTHLDRSVALKFLAPHLFVEKEDSRQRFLREATAAAAQDHPSIRTIHEIAEADGQTFLTMAYLEGQTVAQKARAGPRKLEEALGNRWAPQRPRKRSRPSRY